jgi:hypothetical protein
LEGGEGAAAEAFVTRLELFEHVEAGADFGLSAGQPVEFLAGLLELLLQFAQTCLALLDGAALGQDAGLLGFDVGLELDDARCSRRARSSSSWIFSAESFSRRDVWACF